MVELDHESSLLTTFNTPLGKYKWLPLHFGLKVSADVFQERLNAVLKEGKESRDASTTSSREG